MRWVERAKKAHVRAGSELPGHQVAASNRVCWNVGSLVPSWAKQARSRRFFRNHRSQMLLDGPVLFGIHAHRNLEDKHGHPLPPGPPLRYPFLRHRPEHALQNWSRIYGPLFSVWLGIQLFVVISDAFIARDLLVSNSAVGIRVLHQVSGYTLWPRHHCDRKGAMSETR
jgi:hypothetical protein